MGPTLLDFAELGPVVIMVCVAVTVVMVEPFVTTTAVVETMLVLPAELVGSSRAEVAEAGVEDGAGVGVVLDVDSELLVDVVDGVVVVDEVVELVGGGVVVLSVVGVGVVVGSGAVLVGRSVMSVSVGVGVAQSILRFTGRSSDFD